MLSIIFVIVCGFFNWKRVYAGLFIYVLLLEIKLWREEGWDHINRFNPATIYACPMAGPEFSASYIVFFFVFSEFI